MKLYNLQGYSIYSIYNRSPKWGIMSKELNHVEQGTLSSGSFLGALKFKISKGKKARPSLNNSQAAADRKRMPSIPGQRS